jgi:serine/threonine-protein kinase
MYCPWCGAATSAPDTAETTAGSASSVNDGGADAMARFAPGRIFASRYRIVSLLGRGGMGEVYRADDLRLGQPVAVKLLGLEDSGEARPAHQFVAEVRLARDIAHPNVCRVYDIGTADGWHYLSMEFVDGETLASLLRRIGRLPREKALDVAWQLCAGLAAAHEKGVLHRDIKPPNVMIDGRGRARLMDFGLAIEADRTRTTQYAGTPAYMAPELLLGVPASVTTDIYALGLVLYELFTGQRLFPVRSAEERLVLGYDAPLMRIDPQIDALIRDCLDADPDRRPTSALAVAMRLPGSGPLAAAIAEGRLLAPDVIAASGEAGGLRPLLAWTLVAAVAAGAVGIAATAPGVTGLTAAAFQKSPDVLVERARTILQIIGHNGPRADSEFWFEATRPNDGRQVRDVWFVYRQSASTLIPANLFRVVTADDPAPIAAGMATVTLDSSGRLLQFRIIPDVERISRPPPAWAELFREAGLDPADFTSGSPERALSAPHDAQLVWRRASDARPPVRVTAATLSGLPILFDASDLEGAAPAARNPLASRPLPWLEAFFWAGVATTFIGAGLVARRNLRAGEGDRDGARRLAAFVAVGGILLAVSWAHHVPRVFEEVSYLVNVTGWALAWAGFSWIVYMALEPYVRRAWPTMLVSWTRLISGQLRDPLVGRDLLVGTLIGTVMVGLSVIREGVGSGVSAESLTQALVSVRSLRHFTHGIVFAVTNGIQNALAGLFLLMLISKATRSRWLAAAVCAILTVPVMAVSFSTHPVWLVLSVAVLFSGFSTLVGFGLLAGVTAIVTTGLYMAVPLTLDMSAWHAGYSNSMLLIIFALAVYGASVASRAEVAVRQSQVVSDRAPSPGA